MPTDLRNLCLLFALTLTLLATAQKGEGPSKKDLQKTSWNTSTARAWPVLDKDGDVEFKYEGKTYFLSVTPDDPVFFRLILPNIWPIESEPERTQVHIAVDHVNAEAKVAKAYIAQEDVWLAIECFLPEAGDSRPSSHAHWRPWEGAVDLFVMKMRSGRAGSGGSGVTCRRRLWRPLRRARPSALPTSICIEAPAWDSFTIMFDTIRSMLQPPRSSVARCCSPLRTKRTPSPNGASIWRSRTEPVLGIPSGSFSMRLQP